ncbi:hypothetical protein [Echinicola sp. 20G]|uniref:hypothetical protein n=1 Tax=Echinicola sp. 20G TaxID=2781961 RepID=UPI00190FE712|nr:hypothetical protein [Echinicola sp. 20G]
MNFKLNFVGIMFSAIAIFSSCSKDFPEPVAGSSPVSFGFKLPDGNIQAREQSNDFSLVVKALVTITKADGTATEYTKTELELFESDGVFYAEEVFLPFGDYKVTELYLLDGEGTTLFAVPVSGKLQAYIDKQLPIPFTVEKSSSIKTVILEVLSTLGFTPEEFGFDPDEIVFETADFFSIGLVDKANPSNFLTGELRLKSVKHDEIELDSITRILLKEDYFKDGAFSFYLISEGYERVDVVLQKDSLLKYIKDPLLIEMEKEQSTYAFRAGVQALSSSYVQGKGFNAMEDVAKAHITIVQKDGGATDYEEVELEVYVELDVYKENRGYFLEEIFLPKGNYSIVELYLEDEEGEVLFAVPIDGYLREYYRYSLPLSLPVTIDEEINQASYAVMNTQGFMPFEFGFDPDKVKFKDPVSLFFYVRLQEKDTPGKLLTGRLLIGANGSTEKEINQTTRVNLYEDHIVNDEVYLKVQSEGYEEFKYIFSTDSLQGHDREHPLVIELVEENPVVDGEYSGNLVLETQADVDKFSKYQAEFIKGNLEITDKSTGEDVITDISGLKGLMKIGGSLILEKCSGLKSLNGLNSLVEINLGLIISEVNKLENLEGLENLQKVNGRINIEKNSALKTLKGISSLSIIKEIMEISENPYLVNLEGLENIQEIKSLTLNDNRRLASLKGLDHISGFSELVLEKMEALVNFDDFDTSIESISGLQILQNSNLESLEGLMLPSGKIHGGVSISECSSLRSLSGLYFDADLRFSFELYGNTRLTDISAMSSIKTIGRNLKIEMCHTLASLQGLENLNSVGNEFGSNKNYELEIFDNSLLYDFCSLTNLITKGIVYVYDVQKNGYNPTRSDIEEGKCSEED